ncbi:hypothetical protein CFE70_010008 [Pyrenophora teres f. teres 0-1]|nr:hypothetical protein HRS9139_07954 [Pyrenophora teres f. teres]KAE8832299.1 hypothetical protein PTNB85_06691 [Pyrenophora teres f. teres]KAE8837092.1 hypothetical protein HRS9122_07247 [Pyrenophora teres f. teres]KAE8855961.1 hypothetical protein PTNB29_08800 [Pyrenophora teres f. teres]KAE8860387.1 hypothetical protein PTNB73_07997 [Pyrenophora teres f. teres]
MKLPIQSLRVHGVGMSEKVFDIACALADVLPFVQVTPSQLELNPVDYLKQLVLLLVKLPGGFTKFAPLLLIKVGELLPELMNPIKEAMDIQINFRHPMSPDSRFAYEEEVGQGLYAALRRAEQPGGKNVIQVSPSAKYLIVANIQKLQDPYQTSCRPANPAPSVS